MARPRDVRKPARKGRRREAGEAPGGASAVGAAGASAQQWESREEALTFPAAAAAEPADAGRLVLPASGTAEEILARQAARDVVAAPPRAASARATTPDEPASPAQPIVSFFTSAQAREETKAVEATEHLATFFLEHEEYGVDVRLVQEIIRVSEITQVPRAPESIRGVINLRGRIIPVVDLKRKLGLGECAPGRAARIVVVKLRERLIGLLVDGASQVLKVPLSTIEAAPEEVVEIEAHFIRGVAKLESRLIILLDLPKVLQLELREEA